MSEVDVLAAQVPEGVRLDVSDDVLRGQGEWLFERDGGRRVLAQMRGDLILAPKAAQRMRFVLESRTAWLGDRGIPYVFGVAPSEHAVHTEKLPDGVLLAPRRPVVQVLQALAGADSFVRVVYPLEELRAARLEGMVFSSHDSRWNASGALIGYARLLDAVPASVPLRRVEREDVGFAWRPVSGDLGHRLAPHDKRDGLVGRPHPRTARLLWDNRVEGEGRVLITECDPAPDTTCVFFGDRASYRMLAYLSETFRRMVFVDLRTLDHELVEAERPDVVIGLVDEAALIDVPADVEAPTAREVAARKLASGAEPMPELAPLWGQETADASAAPAAAGDGRPR